MDTSAAITGFHNSEVTLPQAERTEMRDRRDTNRERVRRRLAASDKPKPYDFKSQGSYVDKTMVRYANKDYDIDDGIYFLEEDLVGKNGGKITAYAARKMIQEALDNGVFKTPPELHTNCVRVIYDAGYNVDVPVYRLVAIKDFFGNIIGRRVELASVDWIESDPKLLAPWFNDTNQSLSPDTTNGRQFRRVVRLIKFFASSRESWRIRNLSGFGITILASRCFKPELDRDDKSLIQTMQTMLSELNFSLEIECPVKPHDMVASFDDSKAAFFRDKLIDIEEKLEELTSTKDKHDALKLWAKVFNHDYFTRNYVNKSVEAAMAKSLLAEMKSELNDDVADTDKLLDLIHLGIDNLIDWQSVKEMAQKHFDLATEGSSKDVARVNYYQVAKHQGLNFSQEAIDDIKGIIAKYPYSLDFQLCANLLLGTANEEMLKDCLDAGYGSGVINWPIMKLATFEYQNMRT